MIHTVKTDNSKNNIAPQKCLINHFAIAKTPDVTAFFRLSNFSNC